MPSANPSRLSKPLIRGTLSALLLGTILLGQGCGDSTQDTAPDAAKGDSLMISVKGGVVQGDDLDGVRRFLAIPYGKPPVGELRWKAPQANDGWDDVRHETEFVASCPQLADQGAPASTNEDCLYLNVWAPKVAAKAAPVMVWIHGGGNFSGGTGIPVPNTSQLWYDGQEFARRHGIVVVTLQYRLGPLGFMAHAGLSGEGEAVGNQGLLDQRMALIWVQENIAAFGGDADNVTIFGESAGSADVCYHVASPGSRGLFHRAISQSGGCTLRTVGAEFTVAADKPRMEAFGAALGCPAGEGQLECMRDASVEELLANAMQPMPGAGETVVPEWSFAAVIDGQGGFLPDTPKNLFDRGDIAKVPYLLGSNNDEGNTFIVRATNLPTTQDEYMAYLLAAYGDDAAAIAEAYPATAFTDDAKPYRTAVSRVIGDSGLTCGTHDTARRAARAGLPVFMYNFKVDWSILPSLLQAGHAAEIGHVFGLPYLPSPDAESQEVADAMNAYWARFAATGDPNGADALASWPAFTEDDDKRLQLDPGWSVLNDFRAEECAFWRQYHGIDD